MSNIEQPVNINTTHNRITYIEPNDFDGRINGVPMTPDYTDYCIFFDLIAEVSSRLKQDNGKTTIGNQTYIISWTTKKDSPTDKPNWVSFLTGAEAADYKTNFLSTYYTDIHTNEILNKHSIEGLGIESATISYESYYTPTIKIRFVDVRGCSLFGKEESFHTHEKLKEDTIWGAFFTYPYPKFRLQVKGFYGKAVTYQLTLLTFNANFNSNTGNFEIDTTFVGYDFGLIADIPIAYLIAAPNCSYIGSNYWAGQSASNPYWKMGDGKPPKKFTEIMRSIRETLKNNSTSSETVDAEVILTNYEKQNELNKLKSSFNYFGNIYVRLFDFMFTSTDTSCDIGANTITLDTLEPVAQYNKRIQTMYNLDRNIQPITPTIQTPNTNVTQPQINYDLPKKCELDCYTSKRNRNTLFYSDFENINNTNFIGNISVTTDKIKGTPNDPWTLSDIIDAAKTLMKNYDTYKEKYPDTKIPDIFGGLRKKEEKVKTTAINMPSGQAEQTTIGSNVSSFDMSMYEVQQQAQQSQQGRLALDSLKYTKTALTEKTWMGIDMCRTYQNEFEQISKFYSAMVNEDVTYRDTISSGGIMEERDIYDLAGFLPTIGNVFKTLYCHLETFTHIFYTCAENIYGQIKNGDRTFEKLGLKSIENTNYKFEEKDPKKNIAYPFPSVYREEREENKGSDDVNSGTETLETVTWIGELKNRKYDWEEQRFVEAIALAILHTAQENNDNTNNEAYSLLPFIIAPYDLNYGDIAPIASIDKVDSIAGYLALRAVTMFGVSKYKESDAETLGKLDALSIFNLYQSKSLLNRIIFEQIGNKNIADELYNMTLCNSSVMQDRLCFEKSNNLISTDKTNKRKRHPFFIESGDKLVYSYSNSKNSSALIPNHLVSWDDMQTVGGDLQYNGGSGENAAYYTINNHEKIISVLYNLSDENAFKELTNTEIDNSEFINRNSYNVFYGDAYGDGKYFAESVEKVYDNLKSGEISLNGYKENADENKFSNIITNYWSNKFNCLSDTSTPGLYLLNHYEKYGITDDMLLNEYGQRVNKEKYTEYIKSELTQFKGNKVLYDLDKRDFNVNYSEIFVLNPRLGYVADNNTEYRISVFGSSFYYAQNNFTDFPKGVTIMYKGVDFTRNALKALVYSLSLNYGVDLKELCSLKTDNGVITILPRGAVIRLGAILWWDDWRNRFKVDPLIYPGGTKKPSDDEILYNGFISLGSSLNYDKKSKRIGDIDITVKNLLIEKFIYFVENEWPTIMENCELKQKDGNPLTDTDVYQITKLINDTNSDWYKLQNPEYNYFSNLGKKFSCIGAYKNVNGSLYTSLSEINPAQEMLKSVYCGKICAQASKVFDSKSDGKISLSKTTYKKYLNGVVNQMKTILDSELTITEDKKEITDSETDIDIKTQIYTYLKNLWERWFVNNIESDFSVKKFMENTIFIDSMFRNTYNKLHINCEILLRALEEADGTKMAFQFLADIANNHHCMFFGFPDYLGIGGMENDLTYNAMKTIFKPLPFSKIEDFETQNKFIVMYTHKPSEIAESMNSYQYDSFDIYSETGGVLDTFDRDLLEGVTDITDEVDVQTNRYGYNIPSFGIAMGRQNNHIFKRVNVGMSNPVQTEQSINALSAIASRGRGEEGISTIFHGQDLWNVYSGYSYTCNVEMMGNAQISPLMYFQLTGIPMFRGAYMIYGVTHTIKPGDMTTTFKAMKMSKRTLPWCQEWFTSVYVDSKGNTTYISQDDDCSELSSKYYAPNDTEKAKFVNNGKPLGRTRKTYTETEALSNITTVYVTIRNLSGKEQMVSLRVNKALVEGNSGVKAIFNDILNGITDKRTKEFRINPDSLYCYSYREVKNGKKNQPLSNHSYGIAIDINPSQNPFVHGGAPIQEQYPCATENDNKSIRTLTNPIVKVFMAHEWGWGGRYGDYMHFSYFDGR